MKFACFASACEYAQLDKLPFVLVLLALHAITSTRSPASQRSNSPSNNGYIYAQDFLSLLFETAETYPLCTVHPKSIQTYVVPCQIDKDMDSAVDGV